MIFFKTRQPVDPVALVLRICQDAAEGVEQTLCRFVKRLTPITAIDKATDRGLDEVAQQVLAPHFHGPDRAGKKVGGLAFSFSSAAYRPDHAPVLGYNRSFFLG